MPRLAGDISYRLLGGGQPTQACNRKNAFLANPQSKSHHNASMFFDGVTDLALIFGLVDLDIANAWTHMIWVAPQDMNPASDQVLYSVGQNNDSAIEMILEASGKFVCQMYNAGGALIKKREIALEDTDTPGVDGFFFGSNIWHQVVLTWDGATMTVYRNGLNMNSYMTNVTDLGGAQTNTNRLISVMSAHNPLGTSKMAGSVHSNAHWNVALAQAEISTIYNAGMGTDVDLNLGQGNYSSTDSLRTWYRYGEQPSASLFPNHAPFTQYPWTTSQSAANVIRSAPEGSFYRADGTGTVGEATTFQDVANAVTVSTWCKPNTLPAEGVTNDVVRFRNGGGNLDHIALSLITSGGVSYWQYEFSDGAGAFNVLTGTTPVVVDKWYHILGCKQDTFSARFFVNGLDDLPPVIGGIVSSTNAARTTHIGYNGIDLTENFDGDIYDVALWDVPVSENGVRAIYSGGWKNLDLRVTNPCYSEASALKQWWVFGDPSASGTHPTGDTQYPNRAAGGYTMATGMTGVGAEMRNRQIIESNLIGNCASFDAAAGLGTATALPVGISNLFSISAWIKPENLTSGVQYPLFIGPARLNASQNEIIWTIDADSPGEPLVLAVIGSTGTVLQRVRYENLLLANTWQSIVMTWNDVDKIAMYHNGTFVLGIVEENNAGTVSDTSRFIELGGSDNVVISGLDFEGKLSHVGIWAQGLRPNEIKTISSLGHALDLRYNKLDYGSAEDLKHYYKLGEDTFLKGRDFMDTMRGTGVSQMTAEQGTVVVVGDAP